MIIVPVTKAFGMTFLGFFVSSARKVTVSHPKNVSAMKNIAIRTADHECVKKGLNFPISMFMAPGKIRPNNETNVIMANATNITALVFIPLYAI